MSQLFDYGALTYGLRDVKIAVNNLNGTFGTAVDVPSAQLYVANLQTVNAQLEGDDRITATAVRIISAQIQFRFGSIAPQVVELITGGTLDESYSQPNRRQQLNISNRRLPYFGICGKADGEEGGDTHIFVPKVKIMEGFELRMEYNTFSIPEMTAMAVGDDNFLDEDGLPSIVQLVWYETATPVALPPS